MSPISFSTYIPRLSSSGSTMGPSHFHPALRLSTLLSLFSFATAYSRANTTTTGSHGIQVNTHTRARYGPNIGLATSDDTTVSVLLPMSVEEADHNSTVYSEHYPRGPEYVRPPCNMFVLGHSRSFQSSLSCLIPGPRIYGLIAKALTSC